MPSSFRWDVQRVWPALTPQDLGHHESQQDTLPPLSAQIPPFLLLLLSTSSLTPSSVYPAVGVWKWAGASDDVIPVTPMCGLKRDTLLCRSTCSCTSSMPLELDGLDSVSVGVMFSINAAEFGGNLSQLEDWVSFQVTMWGKLRGRKCKMKGTCFIMRSNRKPFTCKL